MALLMLCLAPSAAAQPAGDAAREYQQQQRNLVQDIRAITSWPPEDELQQLKTQFEQVERTYRSVMRSGTNRNAGPEIDAVKTGLKYRIYSLADPAMQANYKDLENNLTTLLRDLSAARSISNPEDQKRFRQIVCSEALPLLETVISKANLTGRSTAISVLPELEVLSPSALQRRLEMYDQVDDALIRILKDDAQPNVIKLRAASSARLFLQKADPVPQVELALANAMLAELKKPLTEWEYQFYLIEALSRIRAPREVVGMKQPLVLQALVDVMQNNSRDILVRCRAAGAIGKTGFDSQINFEPLAWKTVQLAVEAAVTIGQDQNQNQRARRKLCGWHLHLAFHHETEAGKEDRRNPEGMLNRASNSELVRNAYDRLLPIATALMFSDRGVPNDQILKANDWVKKNQPADLTYDPTVPAVNP